MRFHHKSLKARYSAILKDHNIQTEISEVTVSKPDLVGEHMTSIIETARVDFENGERPPLELFLKKRIPNTGNACLDRRMKQMMLREGSFLTEFSQELHSFSKERTKSNGSTNLTSGLFPKTFYYDEDVIIMEDLAKQGYIILPKTDKQDFKTASTVVQHLAKFHAVSFVMVENAGGRKQFEESHPILEEQMLKPESVETLSQIFEPGYGIALEVLKNCTHKEKDEKYEIMKKYKGKVVDNMSEAIRAENLFQCVVHGDCWNNNLMFNKTREKVVLVDFQIPRVGSPNLDLAYFMFTSTKPEVRKRWKELLQIYFKSLKSNIESLGQSFDFKFDDFVEDFVRKSKLGFFFGFCLILGIEAMGSHDTSSQSTDFVDAFSRLVTDWVEANPDKAEVASESMISMINDYLLFGQL